MLLNKFIPHLITIVVNVMLCIYPSIITTSSSILLTLLCIDFAHTKICRGGPPGRNYTSECVPHH